jgi:hypothetical protein
MKLPDTHGLTYATCSTGIDEELKSIADFCRSCNIDVGVESADRRFVSERTINYVVVTYLQGLISDYIVHCVAVRFELSQMSHS